MASKKFYWLKLKEDFFRQKAIKKLRRIAGGDTYTIIYLKMLLLAIKNENKLYFEGVENTFFEEIALDLDEDADNVKITLSYLEQQGLLELVNNEEYLLTECDELVGKESDSAKRVRNHRANKQKVLQCNANVTKSNTEIEKEIEIEIEIENRDRDKELDIDITKVIEKWNSLNLNKLLSVKNNRLKALKARIKEFSNEDVFKAIGNIKESSFLQGKNDRSWTITFDWLLKPNNFIKVLEGNYKDKELNNGFNANNSGIKEEKSGVQGTTAPGWEGVESFDT